MTANTHYSTSVRHCVMIPFLNRHEQVADCLQALLDQRLAETNFLLIDDGSSPAARTHPALAKHLQNPAVHLIQHPANAGVSAARNSGLHWCRQKNMDVVIMIDSDCMPDQDVISEHLRLHQAHPEAACIGGRITGNGKSLWAKLDGITSWIHASPHSMDQNEFRAVHHPYHLATTNFSVKLAQLPQRDFIFDERLKTGEDCLLIRELRANSKDKGKGVFFSSTPRVCHQDRESLRDVFQHHYAWGHHQYFIQLGGDLSPRCFHPLYRFVFSLGFLPLMPIFALAGSILNCKAMWKNQRQFLWLYPFIYLLWLGKAFAVMEAAIRPHACLRQARNTLHYDKAL